MHFIINRKNLKGFTPRHFVLNVSHRIRSLILRAISSSELILNVDIGRCRSFEQLKPNSANYCFEGVGLNGSCVFGHSCVSILSVVEMADDRLVRGRRPAP